MQHKFPFAVLHFIIHSEEIDVNVHPTKMEVRFTNQMQLYDFIETHVRETLHAIELIPETTLGGSRETKKKKEEQRQTRELAPEPFEAARFRNENIPPPPRGGGGGGGGGGDLHRIGNLGIRRAVFFRWNG